MTTAKFRLAPKERMKVIVASEAFRKTRLFKTGHVLSKKHVDGSPCFAASGLYYDEIVQINEQRSGKYHPGASLPHSIFIFGPNGLERPGIRPQLSFPCASPTDDTFMGIPLLYPDEAEKYFEFHGGIVDGAAYIQSIYSDREYFLPAQADHELMQQKMIAFRRIAAALGAKRINVVSEERHSADGSFKASTVFPTNGGPVNGGIGATKSNSNTEVSALMSEFPKPKRAPYRRPEYQSYIKRDRLLADMVAARLEDGALSHHVRLEFEEANHFSADLTAKVLDFGVQLGGELKKSEKITWNVQVEFWPVED